jgi:hypothetical protein
VESRETRGENVDRTDGAGLAVFRMINPGATSTPRRRRATAATAWDPSGAPAASDGFDAWPMKIVTYVAYLLLLSSLLWTLFRGSDPEAG